MMVEELLGIGSYVELTDVKEVKKMMGIQLDDGPNLRRMRKNIRLATKSDVLAATGTSDAENEWSKEGTPKWNYEPDEQSAATMSGSGDSKATAVCSPAKTTSSSGRRWSGG